MFARDVSLAREDRGREFWRGGNVDVDVNEKEYHKSKKYLN